LPWPPVRPATPLVAPLLAWFGLSSLGAAATGWHLEIAVVSAIGKKAAEK
jgi:hypothetical protein